MSKLPKTWAGMQRRIKRQREDRALDAIMGALWRGYTSKRWWNKVFRRVDELERQRSEAREHQAKHGSDIY